METFLLNLLKTSLLGSLAILAMLVLKPLWRERYGEPGKRRVRRMRAAPARRRAAGCGWRWRHFCCCRSIFR